MNRPLLLVGGGGHCKSVIEAAESAGLAIRGFLDLPQRAGRTMLGYEMIGSDDIPRYVDECDFVVTIGFIKDPALRVRLHSRIEEAGGRLATVVASTAHVSRHAVLGEGTVVLHHAVVNAGARVGKGCIINTFADIAHDAVVGDYCHVSTGAVVNGDCRIDGSTFLGSQSVMVNATSVPANSVFAAGCMIRKTLTQPGIYAGNPVALVKPSNINNIKIGG